MPSDQLKPCPFGCGSEWLGIVARETSFVVCDLCRCCGPQKQTVQEAEDAWNTRDAQQENANG